MTTVPAPTVSQSREEWPDAEFDLPEGRQHLTEVVDDDDDWDIEMSLGRTGGAKAKAVVADMVRRRNSSSTFGIRPALPQQSDEDEEDEGVSTIKVSSVLALKSDRPSSPVDEDLEAAFALPSELTQLSLRPLSLNHRSSKNSLEWGDKDHTSSSQSSDAYSTLGFADASPSSNSASSSSSLSLPGSEEEAEVDEDDEELEGLVIPSALFDAGKAGKHLVKMLEMKKKAAVVQDTVKVASSEDDFEMGLVIDDDVDLSPSRLVTQHPRKFSSRSHSMPNNLTPSSSLRPPSRKTTDRAKSPVHPPTASKSVFQKLRLTPSPPLRPIHPSRAQTFQALTSALPPPPTSPSSFLATKPGSLRGQKSHNVLAGSNSPPGTKNLTRKASLSSLDTKPSSSHASGSGATHKLARYEEPTAASRAKIQQPTHKNSTSRMQDFRVPPTRPTTPSSNTAAVRLTMPTVLRHKSRPALSSVFAAPPSPISRTNSPAPARPSSRASARSSNASVTAPKMLKRPKRPKTYGDGTELDAFDDLPTDRDKETKYRVQPKTSGLRVVGGTYSSKSASVTSVDKGTIRRKGRRDASGGSTDSGPALTSATNTLRRSSRFEFPSKTSPESPSKKKKSIGSPTTSTQMRKKPTLIRNLGGANAPKVVGDMKWNPTTLRWEGNDQVLREFDAAVGTSTRPALITHLTGSSIGSPVGSFASGARIVGNMIFDPKRMCWISTLAPDEDEPDVFANMADDEEESWEKIKGGTIRAGSRLGKSSETVEDLTLSPTRSHTRTLSESGSERGSRASMVYDVDAEFANVCRAAEERHRLEMKGWRMSPSSSPSKDAFVEPDRSYLHEIRALATRKY